MKNLKTKEMNLKLRVLARLYRIYTSMGIRCFAVKNGKIDQKIWDKTISDPHGDLYFYLALDDYDLAFVRFDGVKVGIEIKMENGEFIDANMYEVINGGNYESN